MSGYKQWGGWGGGYKSTSGWEKSHFGGFTRVLNDYPYIKIDFDLDIKASGEAASELGTWQAEKLIKLYILKAKEKGLIEKFTSKVIERPSFFGTVIKKYSVVSLNNLAILSTICTSYPEMAPMFEHYKDSILSSTIEMEIQEPEPKKDKGEGEGEGEGQPQGEKEEEGEGDDEGQGEGECDGEDEKESESGSPAEGKQTPKGKSGKSIQDLMGEINESKPWSVADRSLTAFSEKPKFTAFGKKDSISSYQFNAEEKRDSELLIKLLDINFDPKSDEVKNLKLGKLDTSKIAEVPAGNLYTNRG